MPATPYAKVLVSVNGGGLTSGGLTVASAATIALSPESTVGWGPSPKWEIYDFPSGFTAPAGWSTDGSGVIFYLGVTPPSFTLAANTVRWGKWMLRLTVNGAIIDESSALSMLSASGMRGIGVREGAQFGGALKQWVGELQAVLRTLVAATLNFGTDSAGLVLSAVEPTFVTTNATPTSCATAVYAMPDLTLADVLITVTGKKAASADHYVQDFRGRYTRNGGAPVLSGAVIAGANVDASGTLATATATLAISGNSIVPQVTGVAATNITWSVTLQVQPVTTAT